MIVTVRKREEMKIIDDQHAAFVRDDKASFIFSDNITFTSSLFLSDLFLNRRRNSFLFLFLFSDDRREQLAK